MSRVRFKNCGKRSYDCIQNIICVQISRYRVQNLASSPVRVVPVYHGAGAGTVSGYSSTKI